MTGPCRRRSCGHGALWHSHYRAGSDCSACSCPRYRRRRMTLAEILAAAAALAVLAAAVLAFRAVGVWFFP